MIHRQLGHVEKADDYLAWAARLQNAPGELPELYFAASSESGPNTPLGWSIAMHVLAIEAAGAL